MKFELHKRKNEMNNFSSMKSIKSWIFIFFALFLPSCSGEYETHFYSERNIENRENVGVGDFVSGGEVISFPNKDKENFLIEAIKNAKEKIFIEIYTFTKNENILNSLVDAKNRGVDVRILLEWAPYGTPTINNEVYNFFKKNNFTLAYTDNNRYTFTHAKFWLIDEKYYISTGNWTRSFFDKNREYIYIWNDSTTRNFLEKIFLKDFEHQGFVQISEIPPQIVISPLNSREKIENFITSTESEIFLYVQTISDENILKKIAEMEKAGKKIFICTADNEANREASKNFENIWKFGVKPYLHAKIMLADGNEIFLGSQNFTTNSLENNREIGVLIENRIDIYEKIRKDIIEHCQG